MFNLKLITLSLQILVPKKELMEVSICIDEVNFFNNIEYKSRKEVFSKKALQSILR